MKDTNPLKGNYAGLVSNSCTYLAVEDTFECSISLWKLDWPCRISTVGAIGNLYLCNPIVVNFVELYNRAPIAYQTPVANASILHGKRANTTNLRKSTLHVVFVLSFPGSFALNLHFTYTLCTTEESYWSERWICIEIGTWQDRHLKLSHSMVMQIGKICQSNVGCYSYLNLPYGRWKVQLANES